MLIPKYKQEKYGIAPRSQGYHRELDVETGLNIGGFTTFRGSTNPKIVLPSHALFVPGYYYASPLNVFSPTDISWDNFPANTIYVLAYPIPRRITANEIAIEIGGASVTVGATLRMALYDANWVSPSAGGEPPLGMPKNLIRDFGTVAANSIGVKTVTFATNLLDLSADLYWLALNNSHSDVDLVGGKACSGVFGYSSSPINASGFSVPYTYGAFPNPFPWALSKTAHKIGLRFGFWVLNTEGDYWVG